MAEWNRSLSDQALAEGWDVFAIDGDESRLEIQRWDEAEIFASDEEAIAFVERRAADGSALHVAALAAVRKEN